MHTKGQITSWNDEKAFGFISPMSGEKQIFIHISAFSNRGHRPEVGQVVTYDISTDRQGRPCAAKATLPGYRLQRNKKKNSGLLSIALASIFLLVVAVSVLGNRLPPIIVAVYVGLSILTYLVYAMDKSAAKRGAWEKLYNEYADFYNMPIDNKILDTVWSWIFDPNNQFFALITKNETGEALGLAHCHEMPSPLRGAVVGFLDDLYVKPECRGTGCVQALYEGLNKLGKDRGWPFIRWITAENNYRGRASYDKIAEKTHWLTYQMPVE